MSALIGLGVIGAGVALASNKPATPIAPGTARLLPGDAAVTVHRGTPVAATDALLRAGDTLVVQRGVAAVRTAAGTYFAGAGSALAITSGAPLVSKGDVLVQGNDISVALHSATAQINGIARVRQGLTIEVDVYRGGAVVRNATETVGVPRLRRAVLSGNGASLVIAPLVVNGADPWDRRFLGTAIELDAALSARSRGLTMQVANESTDVVGKVVAATGFKDLSVLQSEPIGEVVVAAELARASHLGDSAVTAALKLRSEGASWGLIAFEQGVRQLPPTIAGIDDAVVPASNGAVADIPAVTTPVAPKVQVPVTVPTTKVTTPPATGTGPVVTVPPEQPAPPSNPVAGLVDGLDNLVGGLLGH